ncbi:MAG: hypothetical protein KME21_00085 [Desmonostoc vinosum HA7617-LM4]|jgi:CheY-like chemotaxis protein|nr:hypothetical protein [Desmonostoc vinosum HA7617-LM4]
MRKAAYTILLVSNDLTNMLIKYAVEKAFSKHLDVVIVNSDTEAMYYLENTVSDTSLIYYSLPVMILTDLNKPVLSDIKLLTWIRQHLLLMNIPVIVMRDSEGKDQVLQIMQLGANSYFKKSRSLNNLIYLIKAFLPRSREWGVGSKE